MKEIITSKEHSELSLIEQGYYLKKLIAYKSVVANVTFINEIDSSFWKSRGFQITTAYKLSFDLMFESISFLENENNKLNAYIKSLTT